MGNFNNVTVVNINTTEFSHNGKTFQTYALISDDGHTSNDYIVFNGQLYIAYEDGVKYPMARPTDYSGSVNIYNSFTDSSYERWVEYDLVFADGILQSVSLVQDRITKDLRDANDKRPRPSSPCVTITLSDSEAAYKKLHDNLDGNLNAIREIIGEPKATIVYPQKNKHTGILSHGMGPTRQMHSVVQDMSDFVASGELAGKKTFIGISEIGDNRIMIMDEFNQLHSDK